MDDADPPTQSTIDAISAYNMLANGFGGIDWAGLPMVAALLEIEDVDALLQGIRVIKTYRKDRD